MSVWHDRLFTRLTGAAPDLSRGISQDAARVQPKNAVRYFLANAIGKIADELSSARLLLPWLFGLLAVPGVLIGFLVPLREAGVLIPQIWVAAYGKRFSTRKGLWVLGAGLSALTLLGIGLTAFVADGWVAGSWILILLGIYSLGRGICSVTAKEVAGKIIAKSVRGRLMGWSSSLSGVAILIIGLLLSGQTETLGIEVLALIFVAAGLMWLLAILLFFAIEEPSQPADPKSTAWHAFIEQLQLLKTDASLRYFIFVRSLLLSTALVQPFMILMIQETQGSDLSLLGILLLVTAFVSAVASPVWGYLSDLNAPRQIALAAALAASVSLAVGLSSFYVEIGFLGLASAYAILMLAHTGVRLGRKVYLLDLAEQDNRGAYTALSNTLIGLMMLIGGSLGLVAQFYGTPAMLILLGLLALAGAWGALFLKSVS